MTKKFNSCIKNSKHSIRQSLFLRPFCNDVFKLLKLKYGTNSKKHLLQYNYHSRGRITIGAALSVPFERCLLYNVKENN